MTGTGHSLVWVTAASSAALAYLCEASKIFNLVRCPFFAVDLQSGFGRSYSVQRQSNCHNKKPSCKQTQRARAILEQPGGNPPKSCSASESGREIQELSAVPVTRTISECVKHKDSDAD